MKRLLTLAGLPLLMLSLFGCQQPASTLVSHSLEQPALPADPATYLKDLQDEMEKHWPKNRTLTIVCHGHSVPAGYFKTPTVDTFNSYPYLLHRELKKRYPHAVINVIVTAIGGESSPSGAARFERDVLSHQPDLITIDYALNDRRAGLDQADAAWTDMITAVKEKDIPVLLLTPTPDQRAKRDDPADPLNLHAQQVRRLAAQHGVGLVDSDHAFEAYLANGKALKEVMSQVNHPNRAGHDLVVHELMKWFAQK